VFECAGMIDQDGFSTAAAEAEEALVEDRERAAGPGHSFPQPECYSRVPS
jgi:hypothetical protein